MVVELARGDPLELVLAPHSQISRKADLNLVRDCWQAKLTCHVRAFGSQLVVHSNKLSCRALLKSRF